MEFFGTKFTVALGAWRLRFVLMLEENEAQPARAPSPAPHHARVTIDPAMTRRGARE